MNRYVPETALDVVAVARRAQVSLLAASLAYFGFTSLLPVALLVVILLTAVGGDAVAERTLSVVSSVLGERLGSTVTDVVLAEEDRLPTTVVGLVVLLWSGLRLFRSTDRAFAAVYGERSAVSIPATFRNAVLVFLTNLLALALLGGVGIWLGLSGGVVSAAAPVVLFAALVVVFLPMFYVFPRVGVSLREILPGTVFAAGVWAVASVGFRVYAVLSTPAYGAAGTALLVLTWLYVGGFALLLGATLNAVLGGHVAPDYERLPTDYM